MRTIMDVMSELRSPLYVCKNINSSMLEDKIKEVEKISFFAESLELGETSRLKYLIADLVEKAQDAADLECIFNDVNYFYSQLESIHDQIEAMKLRMKNFGTDEKNVGKEEEEEEEVVVGLEEDVKQLVKKTILNKDMRFQALSIKGMIGIGKKTLARQVYKAVEGQFQRRAWVCLSSGMSNKETFIELIQKLVIGYEGLIERDLSLEEMDNRGLKRILRQHLQGMAYFLVLDNMSDQMQLRSIMEALPDEEHGSRLFYTSCYESREIYVYYTHEMKALDSDKSWKLFLKTINNFTSDENKFSKELERKGREMLKKCGGLPMAKAESKNKDFRELNGNNFLIQLIYVNH